MRFFYFSFFAWYHLLFTFTILSNFSTFMLFIIFAWICINMLFYFSQITDSNKGKSKKWRKILQFPHISLCIDVKNKIGKLCVFNIKNNQYICIQVKDLSLCIFKKWDFNFMSMGRPPISISIKSSSYFFMLTSLTLIHTMSVQQRELDQTD